ncbi:MAG: hypothetical protein QHI48_04665 [Bacteroidota bacterium]|nr:hypothetical protein [Bacteroidota bacterium]
MNAGNAIAMIMHSGVGRMRLTCAALCLFLSIGAFPSCFAVDLAGGIFNNGGTLQIRLKPIGGDFQAAISAILFAIKYDSAYGVTFDTPVNLTGMGIALQTVESSGGWTYRFYSWVGSFTPSWTQNTEVPIMEVQVRGGWGTGTFMLVNSEGYVNGNDPNFYVESLAGLAGGYTNTLYNSSVSNVPLPVVFLSFTAAYSENGVGLEWETESEGVVSYEIERSCDRSLWEKIGGVIVTENRGRIYRWVDRSAAPCTDLSRHGVVSYRIKAVESDGMYTYSPVCIIPVPGTQERSVFPNPMIWGRDRGVSIPVKGRGNAVVRVFSEDGRETTCMEFDSGDESRSDRFIEIRPFRSGAHFILVECGSETALYRLMVIR